MNCIDFERLIALEVEGDLPGRMARRVNRHLMACPHCQDFRERLLVSQALLKEMGEEAAEEAALVEVRRKVLDAIPNKGEPSGFPRWRWALAAGVVAVASLAAIILRAPLRQSPAPIQARHRAFAGPGPAGGLPSALTSGSATALGDSGRAVSLLAGPMGATPEPPRRPSGRAHSARGNSGSRTSNSEARRGTSPLLVKLTTDNPNVVIYWQID